jgi:hypothetical protein
MGSGAGVRAVVVSRKSQKNRRDAGGTEVRFRRGIRCGVWGECGLFQEEIRKERNHV